MQMSYENTIILNTETKSYLVDNMTKTYIPMSPEDMTQCKQLLKKTLICYPQTETYLQDSENCESNILFSRNAHKIVEVCKYRNIKNDNFIKPLGQNSYYVFIKKPLSIREVCFNSTSHMSVLNKTGILSISPNCEITIHGMKIFSRHTRQPNKILDIIPASNFKKISIKNLKDIEPIFHRQISNPLKYVGYDHGFDELTKKLDKEEERLKDTKDIHEFEKTILAKNVIIIITIIVIIIIIRTIIKKIC